MLKMIKKDKIKGKLVFKDLILDTNNYIIYNKNNYNNRIEITKIEKDILQTIMVCMNNGIVATNEMLLKETHSSSSSSLLTWLCYIKKKLMFIEVDVKIKCRKGIGYIFVKE